MARRVLSDDERVLWSTVTRSIAPLRESSKTAADSVRTAPPEPPAPPRPARSVARSVNVPAKPAPPPLTPLGRRKRSRVARGHEAIDGRLDLHGLTQSEAHAALLRFLRAASARGARLVLVITGKGGDDGRGILRRQLPHWLALPDLRALVVGFEQASTRHGGEGAWYISVRREQTPG
ncbi:MAG TPA: Smr/MutS family protein [Pseudolabrys sp.]|nr:Smr/MutS family protein [Pseudolabrys sp.]